MGNEPSQLSGIEIEEKAIEVSDFWSQHSASISHLGHTTSLSVFVGELFVSGPLWSTQTPLEKNSKNLMIYRHPCILKYVSSWQKNSRYHLAVEEVRPLSHVLPALNSLQICIGLHSILNALCFLHEKAGVSHNNVCIGSIYVTKDGSWKLGGMEYLCRFHDLSVDYMQKSRTSRYNKSVDPNEEKNLQQNQSRKDFIDVYAFGVLVCEVLKSRTDDEIPSLAKFYDLCKQNLQEINISQRPKLRSLLEHDFFNHDFIVIHSFLIELPLKTDEERSQFFSTLNEKLGQFSEEIVGNQLGELLLSRMVLLNDMAQNEFLPFLLCPRKEEEGQSKCLFSEEAFKKYLVPKLVKIFSVRDAQIRLLLLNLFPNFMHTFTREELQSCILPELLLGIKDTNDHLVAVTLRTLADLVPLLGAASVVGGKRAKLFIDGRPLAYQGRHSIHNSKRRESLAVPEILPQLILQPDISNNIDAAPIFLPERPRPDGEEEETSTEEVEQSLDEDLENWDDWEINEHQQNLITDNRTTLEYNGLHQNSTVENTATSDEVIASEVEVNTEVSDPNSTSRQKVNFPDISELDIKDQVNNGGRNEEFDFFQDMEPVIETTNKFLIDEEKQDFEKEASSKLNIDESDVQDEGWGVGDWE